MARITYKQARPVILQKLQSQGWRTSGPLKVPHATSPDGDCRVYLKKQALYVTRGKPFRLNDARSTFADMRELAGKSAAQLSSHLLSSECGGPTARITEERAREREEERKQERRRLNAALRRAT